MGNEVIYIKFPWRSFSWADGLYFIIKETEDEYHIVKLDNKGHAEKYPDGRLEIAITGKNNKGIQRTKLVYNL